MKLKITYVKKIELTTKRETKCMNIRPALILKLDFPISVKTAIKDQAWEFSSDEQKKKKKVS